MSAQAPGEALPASPEALSPPAGGSAFPSVKWGEAAADPGQLQKGAKCSSVPQPTLTTLGLPGLPGLLNPKGKPCFVPWVKQKPGTHQRNPIQGHRDTEVGRTTARRGLEARVVSAREGRQFAGLRPPAPTPTQVPASEEHRATPLSLQQGVCARVWVHMCVHVCAWGKEHPKGTCGPSPGCEC